MKLSLHTILILLFCLPFYTNAQKLDVETTARKYLQANKSQWQLTESDLEDMIVSDQYLTKHNGVTHIYFKQRHKGIPLYNAIANVHLLKNGRAFFTTSNFTPNLSEKVNTTVPSLTPEEAIWKAVDHLKIETAKSLELQEQTKDGRLVFHAPSISNSDIVVELSYQKISEEEVRLAWDLAINMLNSADYWSMRIDALTGEVLNKGNYTVYCNHDHHNRDLSCSSFAYNFELPTFNNNIAGSTYHVFPFPVESPVHGTREFVTDPADLTASPFGWHDTNGQDGAEFTITRGNNVHAFQDRDTTNRSSGDEPNGGDSLFFDLPYDPTLEPATATDFATVQLFYANNYLHDFTYAYGLDEAAGNFQANNYNRGGRAGDYVLAQAQDGGGVNNANFGTPPDGGNGVMQMFLWNRNSGDVQVDAPGSIAGVYETRRAEFGPNVDTVELSGEVVLVNDGVGQGTLGCNPIQNDLTGKIAVIDRGECFFTTKVYNAELKGATGAIICNFDGGTFGGMGAGTTDPITIPSVMVNFADCQRLKEFIGQGLEITIKPSDTEGPSQVDGTLDNGIIAHEYGHGISNRLTGGPNQAGCLFNDEQMGEGWSDFFTLVTTVRSDDPSERIRTVGSFARQQDANGSGIRRSPYSPDFNINSQTYHDIIATGAPHPLGEIWVATLWDLYWAMVDEYGFDTDLIHGEGGNNIAVQLVMDGMKFQKCGPGLIDGRDGILAADIANYGGANQCVIWKVFARRGLGFDADQGSSSNRNDGKQSFNPRPDCIKELKIQKHVSPIITGGDLIEVELLVINDKDSMVAEVDFYDLIPERASFDEFISVPEGVASNVENGQVQFRTLDVASGDTVRVVYQLDTDASNYSVQQFFDDMEAGDNNWDFFPLEEEAFLIWEVVDDFGVDGSAAWVVGTSADIEQDQVFQFREPFEVTGEQPVMRFTHSYDTEWGFDGGILQITTDGNTWATLEDNFFRNGYETRLDYQTISIPRLEAFAGKSDGFQTSYLDLSEYTGETVNIRFRFASNASTESTGWFVDDIELLDLVNYNSEACVTSNQGDMNCAVAAEKGTLVDTQLPVSTEEVEAKNVLKLFPNPAADFAHLTFKSPINTTMELRILGVDGKLYQQQQQKAQVGYNYLPLDLSGLTAGFYFVQIEGAFGTYVEKLVIE
ncbi:MAG: M36 family metallopeptidase [Bacteroidota bacterium]